MDATQYREACETVQREAEEAVKAMGLVIPFPSPADRQLRESRKWMATYTRSMDEPKGAA